MREGLPPLSRFEPRLGEAFRHGHLCGTVDGQNLAEAVLANWYQLDNLGQDPVEGNLCVIPRANSQGHKVLMEQGHICRVHQPAVECISRIEGAFRDQATVAWGPGHGPEKLHNPHHVTELGWLRPVSASG